MKLKNKIIVLLLITFAILLVVPSMVNATTVEYTRTITSNDGTIKINFTGLELDATKAYEFSLVEQGDDPESWNRIDAGYTDTTATLTLNAQTTAIRDVLKVADIGFIYIREKDDTTGTYVLESYQVNLKLPYLQSLAYVDEGGKYNLAIQLYGGAIGDKYSNIGSETTYTRWEKVTSEELVEKFLNLKNNNIEISGLENDLPEPPQTGWVLEKAAAYSSKNDGLYLLWVKRTGTKDVYSCIVHDGLPEATEVNQYIQSADLEAPTMETLEITTPLSKDSATGYCYVEPGKIITIRATFSELIYGNVAPTLKIKCGNGEEITLSEGTITGQYILWDYTIREQDKGVIAAVSLTGGDVADEAGNEIASYTCPTLKEGIFKALVYANGSGIVSNPEDGDGENQNPGETPKGEDEETDEDKKGETTGTEDKKDDTTAKGEFPKTGKFTIMSILAVTTIAGTVSFIKTKKYKGI